MDNLVFLAVLFAAACHAGWNALIKGTLDPLTSTMVISVGAAAVSLAALPIVGMPASESWPWLITSAVVHLLYFAALIESYRSGDLGHIYPLARGSAPLMTAVVALVVVGEHLNVLGWSGIVGLVAGVLLLSARGGREFAEYDKRSVAFALCTGMTICLYSIVDGIGARVAGNPAAYSLMLFAGIAFVIVPYALWRGGINILSAARARWPVGLAGGAMQVLSYGIAIWAMTLAPIAVVSALREASVLFGAAIAIVVLKEPLRPVRIAAAVLIVCGLAAIRLA